MDPRTETPSLPSIQSLTEYPQTTHPGVPSSVLPPQSQQHHHQAPPPPPPPPTAAAPPQQHQHPVHHGYPYTHHIHQPHHPHAIPHHSHLHPPPPPPPPHGHQVGAPPIQVTPPQPIPISTSSANGHVAAIATTTTSPTGGVNQQPQLLGPVPVNRRTFRQRRKDPSCDACRERKVKCDATESSPCSECVGRQLKCQFTKDTNRRMSSIRQIRDLEKTLSKALNCMTEYKEQLKENNISIPDTLVAADSELSNAVFDDAVSASGAGGSISSTNGSTSGGLSPLQDYENSSSGSINPSPGKDHSRSNSVVIGDDFKRRRLSIKSEHSYDTYRNKLLKQYNNRVVIPPLYATKKLKEKSRKEHLDSTVYELLPKKDSAEKLIETYKNTYQHWLPVVDWSQFMEIFDSLYSRDNIAEGKQVDMEWAPVIFAVFSLGVRAEDGTTADNEEYVNTAKRLLDSTPKDDEYSIQYVQAALLISVSMEELFRSKASTVWLKHAAHVAIEIGLELASEYNNDEVSNQVWWSLFVWDRIHSTQHTKPFALDHITSKQVNSPPFNSTISMEHLAPVVHITRLLDLFGNTIRESYATTTTLSWASLDLLHSHVESFASLLPSYITMSNEPLEPQALAPALLLHFTRNMIQRVNLSPAAHANLRGSSLEVSASIAVETVNLLERFIEGCSSSSSRTWQKTLGLYATNFITTHLFHCALILLAKEDYEHADFLVTCLQAIDEHRGDCTRFGLFIKGAVSILTSKYENYKPPTTTAPKQYAPWMDPDILAILSADLQSVFTHAWVWDDDATVDATELICSQNDKLDWKDISLDTKSLKQAKNISAMAAKSRTSLTPTNSPPHDKSESNSPPKMETSSSSPLPKGHKRKIEDVDPKMSIANIV